MISPWQREERERERAAAGRKQQQSGNTITNTNHIIYKSSKATTELFKPKRVNGVAPAAARQT